MSQIFNSALKVVRLLQPISGQVVKTETEIVYSIPKVCTNTKIVKVEMDDDMICLVTEKIVPYAKSPLDAFRGRGIHTRINKKTQ